MKDYTNALREIYKTCETRMNYWVALLVVGELLAIGTSIWYLVQNWNTAISIIFLGFIILLVIVGLLIIQTKKTTVFRDNGSVLCISVLAKLDKLYDLSRDKILLDGLKELDYTNTRDEDNIKLINDTYDAISDPNIKNIATSILRKRGYVRYDK